MPVINHKAKIKLKEIQKLKKKSQGDVITRRLKKDDNFIFKLHNVEDLNFFPHDNM